MVSTYAFNYERKSLEGEWEITMTTPRGERSEEITVTKEGERYFGDDGDNRFEIELDGTEVTFTRTMSTPMGEIDLESEGELDGDSMEGVAKMSDGPMADQEIEWIAEKQ